MTSTATTHRKICALLVLYCCSCQFHCLAFKLDAGKLAGQRSKDTDGNHLTVCRAPEAAENGLRLDALGNLISITVLTATFREISTRGLGNKID